MGNVFDNFNFIGCGRFWTVRPKIKTHRDKFIMFFVGVRAGHRLSNTVKRYLYQLILIITPHVSDLDFT